MIRRVTTYLHGSTEELEEIHEEAFAGLEGQERENMEVALHNINYELEIVADVNTEDGSYVFVSCGGEPTRREGSSV